MLVTLVKCCPLCYWSHLLILVIFWSSLKNSLVLLFLALIWKWNILSNISNNVCTHLLCCCVSSYVQQTFKILPLYQQPSRQNECTFLQTMLLICWNFPLCWNFNLILLQRWAHGMVFFRHRNHLFRVRKQWCFGLLVPLLLTVSMSL